MILYEKDTLTLAALAAASLVILWLSFALWRARRELRRLRGPRTVTSMAKEEDDEPDALPGPSVNTLLLIESDDDLRGRLADALDGEFGLRVARTARDVLELAREANPDIAVLGMTPRGDSRNDELCRALKGDIETSHIPVVLLSGLGESVDIVHGLEAGATDYIVKPVDLAVLKARLRSILANRQRLRHTLLAADEPADAAELDTTTLDREFLDQVIDTIHQNIGNPELSIAELGRRMGMSRTAIFNKIKNLTGQTPNEFVRIVRLNKARELLLTRQYLVGEAAREVGFVDSKYFSTVFKKQFGISPSEV
ncbi:MAG: helix-turn-helix domain-containing protein [Mediterranea sp.]|jgi:AraC-like DNA-binding protein/CheY-like chemotaxis protein|nr:helix-turn-helix domain-containing protein [Mediterranea sp.]